MSTEYYMGVDASGFKGDAFCLCVCKKTGSELADTEIVALYKSRDEIAFNEELKKVTELYNIPENHILKQR